MKRWCCVLLALIMLIALPGCGGSDSKKPLAFYSEDKPIIGLGLSREDGLRFAGKPVSTDDRTVSKIEAFQDCVDTYRNFDVEYKKDAIIRLHTASSLISDWRGLKPGDRYDDVLAAYGDDELFLYEDLRVWRLYAAFDETGKILQQTGGTFCMGAFMIVYEPAGAGEETVGDIYIEITSAANNRLKFDCFPIAVHKADGASVALYADADPVHEQFHIPMPEYYEDTNVMEKSGLVFTFDDVVRRGRVHRIVFDDPTYFDDRGVRPGIPIDDVKKAYKDSEIYMQNGPEDVALPAFELLIDYDHNCIVPGDSRVPPRISMRERIYRDPDDPDKVGWVELVTERYDNRTADGEDF